MKTFDEHDTIIGKYYVWFVPFRFNSLVLISNVKSWQMLMFNYKVGGWGEKRPKICLRNI